MKTKIVDYFNMHGHIEIVKAEGDTTVCIAELAQMNEFDTRDMRLDDTTAPIAAYNVLEEEYGRFEKTGGAIDYYDGAWMSFSDGSKLILRDKERYDANTIGF